MILTNLIIEYVVISALLIIDLIIIYYIQTHEKENIVQPDENTISKKNNDEQVTITKYSNIVIEVNKIKIPKLFKNTPPKQNKLKNKEKYYLNNGIFKENIVINKNNYLEDGYTTYLLAVKYGIETIKVIKYNSWRKKV